MDIAPIVARWIHIGAAVIAVGGAFFMRCVLHPLMQSLPEAERIELRAKIMSRWKMVLRACIVALLAAGLYNYLAVTRPLHTGQAAYHAWMGAKIILALLVFTIAEGIVGRAPPFAFIRQNAPRWMTISLLLSTVILAISGVLRFMPVVRP